MSNGVGREVFTDCRDIKYTREAPKWKQTSESNLPPDTKSLGVVWMSEDAVSVHSRFLSL